MQCHTLPCIFGCIPMTGAYNCFIYHYFHNELYNKLSKICPFLCLPWQWRPTHGPLAQRLSSSDSSTCTSTASALAIAISSGGKLSIGNPGTCGATCLRVWGDNAGPHGQSTSISVASESNRGSSYASPSNPSMTASQSCECCRLFGSTSSSGSVCLFSLLGLSVRGQQLGVLHLLLLQCGGVIRPTHYSADPKSCDLGHLLRDAWYIICQGYSGPLLGPGKIIGEAMHWNPLCFILG